MTCENTDLDENKDRDSTAVVTRFQRRPRAVPANNLKVESGRRFVQSSHVKFFLEGLLAFQMFSVGSFLNEYVK